MVLNKILGDAEERMKKTVEATRRELASIRSGKASPALLDTVRVEAYGQLVPLQQVGSVSAPEPRLIVVQPWDKSLLKAVSRAIQQSDLGLNPTDDGAVIRVPIPQLTEERRKDLVKVIAKLTEDGRVHIRQVRHDVNNAVKHQQHDHDLAEDDAKRLTSEVQKLTDRYIAMLDEILKKKTAEVMEV
jgi:ribosome recycling factor